MTLLFGCENQVTEIRAGVTKSGLLHCTPLWTTGYHDEQTAMSADVLSIQHSVGGMHGLHVIEKL